MIKHVGKHNDKKVVILYRKVPDEDWMTLLVYSDSLSNALHDDVMRVLETPGGQNEDTFADALFRDIGSNGQNLLHTLHHGGHIKKVPTSQVMITPMPGQRIRLDQLNELLDKLAKGEDAAKEMLKYDSATADTGIASGTPALLSDADLANQRRDQAVKMEREAASLLAEAAKLKAEAEALSPTPVAVELPEANVNTQVIKKVTRKNANAKEKSKETPV